MVMSNGSGRKEGGVGGGGGGVATLKRRRYFLRFIDVVLFGHYCLSGHPPEAETIAQQLQEAGVIRTECQLLSGPGAL